MNKKMTKKIVASLTFRHFCWGVRPTAPCVLKIVEVKFFLFFISFFPWHAYSAHKEQIESDKEECRTIGTLGSCNNYEEYIQGKKINDKLDDNKRKREAILNDFDALVDKKTGLTIRLLTFNLSLDKEMKREKKKEDKRAMVSLMKCRL